MVPGPTLDIYLPFVYKLQELFFLYIVISWIIWSYDEPTQHVKQNYSLVEDGDILMHVFLGKACHHLGSNFLKYINEQINWVISKVNILCITSPSF